MRCFDLEVQPVQVALFFGNFANLWLLKISG
ncbi:hypothetical protein M876_12195 [Elizabethkingia anophelis FMS-007]|nr:hypothetical protein M876_12195 [Elizabethkingia anophelis FMS-007]